MTTQPFPKRDGRVFFIGTAGGCSKPSSGYTFTRIQHQCRQLAEAAQSGTLESFREKPASWRYSFFDTVFLQALKDRPEAFPGYFHRLFSRVPPDALTAFLSETSTMGQRFPNSPQPSAEAVPSGRAPVYAALGRAAAVANLRAGLTYPAWAGAGRRAALGAFFPGALPYAGSSGPLWPAMVVLGLPPRRPWTI